MSRSSVQTWLGPLKRIKMRIIENPNPIDELTVVCSKCSCKFAYTEGDTKVESWNNGILGPGNAGYYKKWVNCPNCGECYIIEHESHDHMNYNFDIPHITELESLINEKS